MATIGSQGLVDDGSSNLNVAGVATLGGISMVNASLGGSGSLVSIPFPGFFSIPVTGSAGASQFTGSMPSAATYPGGHIMVTDSSGIYPYLLTGSFAMMSGSTTPAGSGVARSVNGTKLAMSTGASVGLWSDSKGWLVTALSGTATLT